MKVRILQATGAHASRLLAGRLATRGSAILSPEDWDEVSRNLRLSRRESEIIRYMFDGEKEASIATRLGISSHTVHAHFGRLHRKLGTNDHVSITLAVMREFVRLNDARTIRPQSRSVDEQAPVPP